jgi:preprotein translocase subunit SecA
MQKVLLQILTGEGKSTTIACLAAILAMRGCSVDIITTNKILATRDVEEKRNFFDLMNLRVAHNISAEENSK